MSFTGLLSLSQLRLSLLWPSNCSDREEIPAPLSGLSQDHSFVSMWQWGEKTDLLLILISGLGKAALGLEVILSNQHHCLQQIWSATSRSICIGANRYGAVAKSERWLGQKSWLGAGFSSTAIHEQKEATREGSTVFFPLLLQLSLYDHRSFVFS